MKKILYATDCKNNSASGLKYAFQFSQVIKAELHILHVYDFPQLSRSIIQPREAVKKSMQREQKDTVLKYCKTHLGDQFKEDAITIHVVEKVSVANSILSTAKILSPDLVIIGMKDRQSNRGLFAGNIADKLLDKIERPLMMVPNSLEYKKLETVVYATDFENEDIFYIQKLIEIVSLFDAHLEIVHIQKTDETAPKEQMEAFKNTLLKQITYSKISFRNVVSTKIKSGLLSIVNNEKVDMLAMLERKQSLRLKNIFHKDLVKNMETTLAIPILAFSKSAKKAN